MHLVGWVFVATTLVLPQSGLLPGVGWCHGMLPTAARRWRHAHSYQRSWKGLVMVLMRPKGWPTWVAVALMSWLPQGVVLTQELCYTLGPAPSAPGTAARLKRWARPLSRSPLRQSRLSLRPATTQDAHGTTPAGGKRASSSTCLTSCTDLLHCLVVQAAVWEPACWSCASALAACTPDPA